MQNNEIIDVVCREVPTHQAQRRVSVLGVALTFATATASGGAGMGLWSGDVAMAGLLLLAALALVAGLCAKSGRRVSSVFGLTAVIGMVGLLAALVNMHVVLTCAGVALAGASLLVLSKVHARGWNHA